MRLRLAVIAVVAFCGGAASFAADPALTSDDATAPKAEGAPATTAPAASGKLQIQPAPQPPQPAQPPNLTIPPPAVTPPQPGQPAPAANPPPTETIGRHQEPGPGGQDPNGPPRGTGAAMIPKETPSGVQAIEDWIASWFR